MIFNIMEFRLRNRSEAQAKAKAYYEHKNNKIYRLKRGLYTDDPHENPILIANCLLTPSYVSFEYALSFYDLIPEGVYEYTSASVYSRGETRYSNHFGRFSYRNVPKKCFAYGLISSNGTLFATKEKALCDLLHVKPSVRSKADLSDLLFEDLRIEPEDFAGLNHEDLLALCDLYPGDTFRVLKAFLKE